MAPSVNLGGKDVASRYFCQAEVSHKGLNKYRIVKAATQYELDQKTAALMAQWDEQWAKKVEREGKLKNSEDSLAYANEMTQQAESIQKALDTMLIDSLNPKSLDLNELKNFSKYPEASPKQPLLKELPYEPQLSDAKYNPQPSFFIKISKNKMAEFKNNNIAKYNNDLDAYKAARTEIEVKNDAALQDYNACVTQWENRRNTFLKEQSESNEKIDQFFEKYKVGNIEAVERYYTLLLEKINLPFTFDRSVEVEYNADNKTLIIDLLLPTIDDLPNLKAVSYVKSKNELKEAYHSEPYMKKKYDSVVYQIVLQILNYVFTVGAEYEMVNAAVLNGKINTIDKATGKNIEPYVLSVNIARTAFEEVNLSAVDPKTWFKNSKGVSAATFANVTPIAPIVKMEREDHRFVDGYAVVDSLDDSVNLAAIDWQDFENLIREIFEREFNINGGEVKITQASRDGGVDAVAFDPDPIRGGKIVIQAKRYTNVVGVSAVRDLYGTVMNEGATKGILVTTSNYGNDAYSFAQGKPLTLMNGANLLYLLEKHGYKARIDIKEAKDILYGEGK